MYSAVSSIPLAATGLVICWNLPMNRARSSHSSLVVIRVCLSRSRSMKSQTRAGNAGALPFRGLRRLIDVSPVVLADALVRSLRVDIRAVDREARDDFLERRD